MRVAHRKHGAPDDSRGMSPDYVAIVTALRRVPPSQRQAIVLHHLAGKSVDEIARETGAASGTVKARLSRGRPSDRGWTENRRTLARSRAAARRLAMSLRCTEYGAVAKGWPPLISCKNGSSADLSKAPEPAARPEDEHPFARPEAGLVDEAHGGSAIVEQGGRLCHPQTFWHDQAERDGRVSPARLLASPGRGVARIRWISSRVQFVFPDAGEG